MNCSHPFAPAPFNTHQPESLLRVMGLAHPSTPGADQHTALQLTTAMETELIGLCGPGATRCFVAEPYAAYRSFYLLLMTAFATAGKENFKPRILYFSTLPVPAKTALRDLEREKRLALICYTPAYNGAIDVPAVKRLLAGAANTILISAPYVSGYGHRIEADQLAALAEAGRACAKTPLHLDMTFAREIRDVYRSVAQVQALTWDLSYGGLADTALLYLRDDLYRGWRIDLTRIRESPIAVVSSIRSFRAHGHGATAGLRAEGSAQMIARLTACRDGLQANSAVAAIGLRFVTFDEYALSSPPSAFITLNKLGKDDAMWYPGILSFALVIGRQVVPALELQEYGRAKLGLFLHAVDMSSDVREGSDLLVVHVLKNTVVLTEAVTQLFYLLEEFLIRHSPP